MPYRKCLIGLGIVVLALVLAKQSVAENTPVLTWITNQSLKLEQIIGDLDWADLANGVTNPTTSRTVSRFHILGTDNGGSFEDNGRLIILFGDTISDDSSAWPYHAADPFCWSTNTDGDSGLLVNFYTNRPYNTNKSTPAFVQPSGIVMGPNCVPKCGIALFNGVFVICNTGSDPNNTNNPHLSDYSVLVTFNETNLLTLANTYQNTNLVFYTNRTISSLNTNLAPTNPMQGHFIFTSIHEFGTNVLIFGTGEFRASDIYLSMVPSANLVSGQGTVYFTGFTNGQPSWSPYESNSVPVVQDNPDGGPAWPNDNPSAGDLSVINPPGIGLWLMTFDGGRNANKPRLEQGIYFSYASAPWGPWTTPQLIFNPVRDLGRGVFIYDAATQSGPAGPTIDPSKNDPTNTPGTVYGPYMIERFTRIATNTLFIYYTMSTWNPYTVLKMRSAFTISPDIDPNSLVKTKRKFTFSWSAPTNLSYQVDYSTDLLSNWATITNVLISTNGTFNFSDTGTNTGGLGSPKFYRVRSAP